MLGGNRIQGTVTIDALSASATGKGQVTAALGVIRPLASTIAGHGQVTASFGGVARALVSTVAGRGQVAAPPSRGTGLNFRGCWQGNGD